MSKPVLVTFQAGTEKFTVDLANLNSHMLDFGEKSAAAMKKAEEAAKRAAEAAKKLGEAHEKGGHQAITNVQAISGSLRGLEGGLNNNLRAAERFLGSFKGLAAVAQAFFPVAGMMAVGGILVKMGEEAYKAYEAFKKLQNAPTEIANAFNDLNAPLDLTNAKLQIQSDQLQREIDKLEHKPHNGLKEVLDESILAARELSAELDKDSKSLATLLKERGMGVIEGLFTGQANTADIKDKADEFERRRQKIETDANAKRFESGADSSTLEGAKAINALEQDKLAQETALLKEERAYYLATLNAAKETKTTSLSQLSPYSPVSPYQTILKYSPLDQAARISAASGMLENIDAQMANRGITQTIAGQKTEIRASTDTRELDLANRRVPDALAELQIKLQGLRSLSQAMADSPNPFVRALAKGAADAEEKIRRLNEEMAKSKVGPKEVTPEQAKAITANMQAIATREAINEQEKTRNELVKEGITIAQKMAEEDDKSLKAAGDKLETLQREIDAQRILTATIGQGDAAEHAAQVAVTLARIKPEEPTMANLLNQSGVLEQKQTLPAAFGHAATQVTAGHVPTEAEATKTKLEEDYASSIARTVDKLNTETEATERLTAAIGKGRTARRQAELDNLLAPLRQDMDYYNKHPEKDPDGILKSKTQEKIDATTAQAKAKFKQEDATAGIGQSAKDGLKQYFQQVSDNAKSTGVIVRDELGGAFNSLGQTMSAMIAGQKVSWSSFFSGIASQMSQLATNQLFGMLGKGITGFMNRGNDAFSNPFGNSFKAEGGYVYANQPYYVGERGIEKFTPSTSGTITPNNALRGTGGSSVTNIDARGSTDPDLTARNVRRAIQASNQSSVQSSLQASHEMARRTAR